MRDPIRRNAYRLRDLQSRHWPRRQRSGDGAYILRGQQRSRSLRDRPAPRRRSGDGLRRSVQGEAGPWLGSEKDARRHVPRQLELAKQKPDRVLS